MKKFRLLFALLATTIYISASAQQHSVQGNVTDSSGTPLSNVTVNVKGTKISALTNTSGSFSINVPNNNAVLEISSVGYATQSVEAGSQSTINVQLAATTNQLDAVVVVGYGTTKKKDLTGSVASINSDNLNLGGTVSNVGAGNTG